MAKSTLTKIFKKNYKKSINFLQHGKLKILKFKIFNLRDIKIHNYAICFLISAR